MVTPILLDIFISSPSDVSEERKVVLAVIEQFNRRKTIQEHYVLKPLAYENIVPGAVGESPQRAVDHYMMEAGKTDIFICILWSRMGTPVVDEASGETFESGTENEFMNAYRANQSSRSLDSPGKPYILLYRCKRPISPVDADLTQAIKVQQFFKQFEGAHAVMKGLYKLYESPSDFERILSDDLDTLLAENLRKRDRLDAQVSSEPLPIRRDFYRHVLLPPNYVPREELLAEVRASLLTEAPHIALTSAVLGRPIAFHGMGGIGKTVMARALCDDSAVLAAFPDGILWVSLGKDVTEASVIERMREWVTALGETVTDSAPSLNTLKARLGQLLAARACLLIVDDVWQYTRADHFRVGGPHCRLVITTRDAEVARALGARVQPISLMTEDEAVGLLVSWADGALAVVESDMQKRIVQRLGRLPLAVRLAGAQLRRQRPEDWLRRFDVRKLWASRPEDIHASLELTFKLSLEDVEAQVQSLYAALVIFREDEAILEVGIARLWEGLKGLEREQTSAVIDELASRALLQVSADSPRTIVLHDLLRDLMRAELDSDVVVIHEALLNAYANTKTGDDWPSASDDGYLYTHLASHLLAAGRKEELGVLLTSSPSWMDAKFHALGSDTSYAGDVDLAITAFEGAVIATELLQLAQLVAARQVIQQRVSIYTDTNLETLVWLGRDAEAVSHARLRPDLQAKATGLRMIHDAQWKRGHAEGKLLVEASEVARAIENAYSRAEALGTVARALAQAGRVEEASQTLTEALEAARAIENADRRALMLGTVARALAQAGRGELALEAARTIENAYRRAEALGAVAGALAQAGQFWEAFFVLRPLDLYKCLEAITKWLPLLDKLETALSLAVVGEVVRIIGWVWPQWHKIYSILATSR